MKWNARRWLFAMLFFLLSAAALHMLLMERSQASILKPDSCESDDFREQNLTPGLYGKITDMALRGEDFAGILTASMLHGKFYPREPFADKSVYLKYKRREFLLLRSFYEAIWADVTYFPIPDENITFSDTFGEPRNYGKERLHEGTDLFGEVEESGYYPVLSMTDGIVEQKGWLPLGGYRIGIRAPHGAYFYYAHLSEYGKDFRMGEEIKAGDILGYMGNTGYGPEGTQGKFPVHLHLGIYIHTPYSEELSVNPYWILRCVCKKIVKYTY